MGGIFSGLFRPAAGRRSTSYVDRSTYYENHPGLHNNLTNGIESEVTVRTLAATDVTDTTVIKVTKLDLDVKKNAEAHHTDEYDITDPEVYKKVMGTNEHRQDLVIRRGQSFNIKIEFNRPYNQKADDLRLVFQFGKQPRPSKGTHAEFILSDKDKPREWGAFVAANEGNTLTVTVTSPATIAVGKWSFMIDVVKRADRNVDIHRHKHPSPIYILFNPWCKDDLVYMKEEALLGEYILNESGKIYSGSSSSLTFKPWSFGQFEGIIIDCVMYLLEKSRLPDKARGNPILVSRAMSKLVNSSDDNGVLTGNWSGTYTGGTSPLEWTGSVDILNEYLAKKQPVRFGQCWVFSGVLTTVCRALGIPTRSVTNFSSAHDTDGSITIDKHYDHKGKPLKHLDHDSVWNFHVWNDAWMARPDLAQGYGGWQAIDSTPQETSDGFYQTGPASLLAIQRGEVLMPYDAQFIFAEVNADYVFWRKEVDGSMNVVGTRERGVGKFISTKRPHERASWGRAMDREDVTDQYKFKEGSDEERVAVHRANEFSSRVEYNIYEKREEDVTFKLSADKSVHMGETVKFAVYMKNTSSSKRTLNGSVTLDSATYTGLTYKEVITRDINFTLQAGEEKSMDVEVQAADYYDKLTDHCILMISCMCMVEETKQTYTYIDDLRLHKPHLSIKAPDKSRVGQEFEVEVSFVNPLQLTLTKCHLRVDGPGLSTPTIYNQPNVGGGQTFEGKFNMRAMKRGEREIIVYFNCQQISAVTNSHPMNISA